MGERESSRKTAVHIDNLRPMIGMKRLNKNERIGELVGVGKRINEALNEST